MDADFFKESGADFSQCRKYRYRLWRKWGEGAKVGFVMLNPSTADEHRNDPTIERCHRRAVAMGFSALEIVNIFAFRATDPKDLKRAKKPVGPDNDQAILKAAEDCDQLICAWGSHGNHKLRSEGVKRLLASNNIDVFALSLTKQGEPGHPLYIPYTQRPQPWIIGCNR